MKLFQSARSTTRSFAFCFLATAMIYPSVALKAAGRYSDLSSDDSSFVKNAAEGGQAEVEFANLALKKSHNSDVRAFASRMVQDHSKANMKLKEVAQSKGVKTPTGIGVENNAELLKLKALSGSTFDKSYVDMMVDDHKKDVADFQKESEGGADDAVKKFATDTLPTLQEHYKLVQELQAKMK
jgi:putative membrane protein